MAIQSYLCSTTAAAVMLLFGQFSVNGQNTPAKDIVTTAIEAGSFQTLAAALKAAGLVETLQGQGPFTVFAPSDEAFSKLPAGTVETLLKPENKQALISVLTYHVVPGKVLAADVVKLNTATTVNGQRIKIKINDGKVQVDQAQVVTTDIRCSNGVIHVIDNVLLPSLDKIPAVAEKAGTFKTLLAAATAAGLVDVLSGDKPLTVFAPTDDAFAKLPAGTVESLLKPENKEKLASILKFHVIPGRVFSNDVLSKKDLKTVQGGTLTATVNNGHPMINGAGLVTTDIPAANGVIHVIDAVLLPPATPAKAAAIAPVTTQFVTHVCPQTGQLITTQVNTQVNTQVTTQVRRGRRH
jgi:transforming growth factor-beta-induced protein